MCRKFLTSRCSRSTSLWGLRGLLSIAKQKVATKFDVCVAQSLFSIWGWKICINPGKLFLFFYSYSHFFFVDHQSIVFSTHVPHLIHQVLNYLQRVSIFLGYYIKLSHFLTARSRFNEYKYKADLKRENVRTIYGTCRLKSVESIETKLFL